jgi:hypothetical protein
VQLFNFHNQILMQQVREVWGVILELVETEVLGQPVVWVVHIMLVAQLMRED